MAVSLPGWPSQALDAALSILSSQYCDSIGDTAGADRRVRWRDTGYGDSAASAARGLGASHALALLLLGDFLQAPRVIERASMALGTPQSPASAPDWPCGPVVWEAALTNGDDAAVSRSDGSFLAPALVTVRTLPPHLLPVYRTQYRKPSWQPTTEYKTL